MQQRQAQQLGGGGDDQLDRPRAAMLAARGEPPLRLPRTAYAPWCTGTQQNAARRLG
jgi:hypothetical protein